MQTHPELTELPYSLDIARLSGAYEAGRLTPRTVVEDVLNVIATQGNANPVWIYVLPRETLIARAADLERRRDAGERLPLYGIPFAVKDNIDVAGHPTTAACPAYEYIPETSAHVVERLESAGAICVGKTNMDQFATGLVGTRSPYGACRNPFASEYISGGSSSGSAVAVAMGHVSFSLGTDTAGSGRVPAAFCNIVGIKPTRGLISTRGVVPACRSLDCVSIFALTVEDAQTVAACVMAFDAEDAFSRSAGPKPTTPRQKLRCGVPQASDLRFFGDPVAHAAYESALSTLQTIGAEIIEIDYGPYADAAKLLYDGPWLAERRAAIGGFFDKSADAMDPVVRGIVAGADAFDAVDAFEAQYRLRALARECEPVWRDIDVMVVPTAGTIYRLEDVAAEPVLRNAELGYYTNFVNLLDLAAVAVPGPFREDALPAGITFIGPAFSDATLLHWAGRFHRAHAKYLGATSFTLPSDRGRSPDRNENDVCIAVVGAHLSGMPLNHQLTSRGAGLVGVRTTAPQYRLYALPNTLPPKPALVRENDGCGAAILVEVWQMPLENFGAFVAEVPPPLAIGTLTLDDGTQVKGFVCEGYALEGARDITSYGGWRSYMHAQSTGAGHTEQTA